LDRGWEKGKDKVAPPTYAAVRKDAEAHLTSPQEKGGGESRILDVQPRKKEKERVSTL